MGENIRTYEELLIERVNKTVTALDNEDRAQFDRVMENTEILLGIKKGLYNMYIKWKEHYGKMLLLAYNQIEQQVAGVDDPYMKEMMRKQKETVAEWGYRIDILQKLISLLNDYNLVPFGIPEYAEIQPEEPPSEEPNEQPQEQPKERSQKEQIAEQMERLKEEETQILQQQQTEKQQVPEKKVRFAPRKNS